MPGLDLEHLSSNWKKLQEKLKSAPKDQAQKPTQKSSTSNGQKRKRQSEAVVGKGHDQENKQRKAPRRTPTATGANTTSTFQRPIKHPRKMGLTPSHPPNPDDTAPPSLPPNHLLEHPIKTSLPLSHIPPTPDTPNTGLHPAHKPGKYLSLDCEMVGTGPPPHSDSLLARASIVNYHGQQIYDSYVLPPAGESITDYRTFVSGIRPVHLKSGVARPFAEVQADVARLLQGKILVGHALRNDLQVLLLSHPARDVRDTSRYAGFRVESRGKPPALRVLVQRELGWQGFQSGEHSSLEDARAAMGLWRKEKKGFEEEVRRRFGVRREGKKGGKGREVVEAGQSDGDEDEALEGEKEDLEDEGSEAEEEGGPAVPKTAKKKRKKKKRTKR